MTIRPTNKKYCDTFCNTFLLFFLRPVNVKPTQKNGTRNLYHPVPLWRRRWPPAFLNDLQVVLVVSGNSKMWHCPTLNSSPPLHPQPSLLDPPRLPRIPVRFTIMMSTPSRECNVTQIIVLRQIRHSNMSRCDRQKDRETNARQASPA